MTPSPALHAVLVHPEIPWNTGNAGRICLAFGARLHLVRPLGFALTARELRRAGLDYWDRVEPVLWAGLDELEAALPELGEPFLFSAEAEKTLWETRFPPRAVLLLITLLIGFVLGLFAATYISSPRRRGAQPPTSGESKSSGASK